MKFNAIIFSLVAGTAAANMSIRGGSKAAAKLMKESRKLQNYGNQGYYGNGQQQYGNQGGYNGQQQYGNQGYNGYQQMEGENPFLASYSLKLLSCVAGEQARNYENGEIDYNSVVFRLCPNSQDGSTSCSDNKTKGCSSGYGDYTVGLQTFVEAYFESQRDNYNFNSVYYDNYGNEFNVEEYTECREYNMDEQQQYYNNGYNNGGQQQQYYNYNGQNGQQQEYGFFIGPTCSADGSNVRLGLYTDQWCQYESQTSFETLTNGWSMPFSDGGLVYSGCMSCMQQNDNYEYEISEMCQQVYEASGARCEENMEVYGYYGQNNQGCDYVKSFTGSSIVEDIEETVTANKTGSANNVKQWVFGIFLLGGLAAAGYVLWTKRRAQSQAKELNEQLTSN